METLQKKKSINIWLLNQMNNRSSMMVRNDFSDSLIPIIVGAGDHEIGMTSQSGIDFTEED